MHLAKVENMESAIIAVVKKILLVWYGVNKISVVGLTLNLWGFS